MRSALYIEKRLPVEKTHKDNLENILHDGLLSHTRARDNKLTQVDIADSEVNIRRGRQESIHSKIIHDYVPLYFNPQNPMLFKRGNIQNAIVILAIDRILILDPNSLFTDGNAAASNGTRFFNEISNLNLLDWKCINGVYWADFPDGKRIKCAEVLVYPSIDLIYLKKIYSNNQETKDFVAKKLVLNPEITVEINHNLFLFRPCLMRTSPTIFFKTSSKRIGWSSFFLSLHCR